MADTVLLAHFEVRREVLLNRGGRLPSTWQGQPFVADEPRTRES